jgi:hypothetical protein
MGQRVRDGYVSAGEAFFRLCQGAERMQDWRPGEPWDMEDVQGTLRAAIMRGNLGTGAAQSSTLRSLA